MSFLDDLPQTEEQRKYQQNFDDMSICMAISSYGPDQELYTKALLVVANAFEMKPEVLQDMILIIRSNHTKKQLLVKFKEIKARRSGQELPKVSH